jgi:hypothetical protein
MLTDKLHIHRQTLLQLLVQQDVLGGEVTTQIIELRAQIAQDKTELYAYGVVPADYLLDEHDSGCWADLAVCADPADALAQLAIVRGLREAARRRLSLRMVMAIRSGLGSGPEILLEIKDLKQLLATLDTVVSILESSIDTALAAEYAPRQREVGGDSPRTAGADIATLRQQHLLVVNRNNLARLMRQAQSYGGFEYAPTATRNNIRAARINIATIESQLRGI